MNMNHKVQKLVLSISMIAGVALLLPATADAATAKGSVNLSLDQAALASLTGTWNNSMPVDRYNSATGTHTMAYVPGTQTSSDTDDHRYFFVQHVWNASPGSTTGSDTFAYGNPYSNTTPNTGTPGNTAVLPVYVPDTYNANGTVKTWKVDPNGSTSTALNGSYRPVDVSNLNLSINNGTLPAGNIATTYDSNTNPTGAIGFAGTMKIVSDIRFPNGSVALGQFSLSKVGSDWFVFDDFTNNSSNPLAHNSLFKLTNVSEDLSGASLALSGDLVFNGTAWGSSLGLDNLSMDVVVGRLSIAPVPVPPAVWLFGSGLISFLGLNGRRKYSA